MSPKTLFIARRGENVNGLLESYAGNYTFLHTNHDVHKSLVPLHRMGLAVKAQKVQGCTSYSLQSHQYQMAQTISHTYTAATVDSAQETGVVARAC
jgi:hypothetical protein